MIIVGLTGLTGAGKSTAAKIFTEKGFYHIDADLVARELINSDSRVKEQLIKRFGKNVILNNGTVDRPALAREAFKDKESTDALNSITHPAVTKKIEEIISLKQADGACGCVIDAIGLFESGENRLCDFTITVTAPFEIRLARIMGRDSISKERAIERMKAQKDEAFYIDKADYIIKNYEPYSIQKQINQILINEHIL